MAKVKSIFKEVFIMLLLCIAIILVLGVIFYDSIPSNKVVPNKPVAYETPENIQEEINEEVSGINKVEVSYEITSSDLTLYKQTNEYISGNPDPFADPTKEDENQPADGTNNNGGSTTTQPGQNNDDQGTTTEPDPNSTGTFFENTGHK